MNSKGNLRVKFKAARDRLSAVYRKSAGGKIARNLFELPEWKRARSVGLYMSRGSEAATDGILKRALAEGKKVRAPKVLTESKMRFFEISGMRDFRKGKFGIYEPKPSCKKVVCSAMDLILVPGIAFDSKGYRLGYGLGFYDRFLPRAFRSFRVGLCYGKTLVPLLPRDGKDQAVHAVVTEKEIFRII